MSRTEMSEMSDELKQSYANGAGEFYIRRPDQLGTLGTAGAGFVVGALGASVLEILNSRYHFFNPGYLGVMYGAVGSLALLYKSIRDHLRADHRPDMYLYMDLRREALAKKDNSSRRDAREKLRSLSEFLLSEDGGFGDNELIAFAKDLLDAEIPVTVKAD